MNMRQILFVLVFMACVAVNARQLRVIDIVSIIADTTDIKIFDLVEQMPAYPGGQSALFEFLSKNIKYPVQAEAKGIQGRVIATFVVEQDGSISNVAIAKSVDPLLDKESTRLINNMPKWIPGKQNGSAVRVKYTVPVTFKLQ